jgi:dipicolinate synthase subunit B
LRLRGKQIGFALPEGHFSMQSILYEIKKMVDSGADVFPLFLGTEETIEHDEQFTKTSLLLEQITGREMLTTSLADEAGENIDFRFDLLVVAPCTGNFLARLMNTRTTSVPLNKTLRHLEAGLPVVLALVANGDSENLFLNVSQILNLKNFYLVPFGPVNKANKQIFLARLELLYDTVLHALASKQLQPVYIEPCWLPH